MVALRLELPRPHPGQRTVFDAARRFNVLSCGRRFGKTRIGIDRAIGPMIAGKPVGWFAPNYKLLREVWEEMKVTFPPRAVAHVDSQDHRIQLVNGGVFECWSLMKEPARGRKYALAIIDEAAMVRDLLRQWTSVIRPTLVDLKGGAWFLSTPRGEDDFFKLWQMEKTEPDWKAFQLPTLSNPFIDPKEIEAAKRITPELIFRQEYLAEFVTNLGSLFKLDWLHYGEPPALVRVYQAWDVAGTEEGMETGDYSVGATIGLDHIGRYWLLDLVRGRWNTGELVEQMLEAAEEWEPAMVWYEGGPVGRATQPWLEKRRQERQMMRRFEMVPHTWGGDKVAKAASLVGVASTGNLFLPTKAPWLADFKKEMASFPYGEHDDQIDAASLLCHQVMRFMPNRAPDGRDTSQPGKVTGADLERMRMIMERQRGRLKSGV